MDKIRVSLLGSTGMVGQKMIRLLENHPYIELVKLSASDSKLSSGFISGISFERRYGEAFDITFIPFFTS